jgi:hypothetical protein
MTITLARFPKFKALGILSLLVAGGFVLKWAMAITAFTPANQPIGYVAQEEMTNFNVTSGFESSFMPEYNREFWSGDLNMFPVTAGGVVDRGNPRWGTGAGDLLNGLNFATQRFIGTLSEESGAAGAAVPVPFLAGSLSSDQQGYFTPAINGTGYAAATIVNYLRGERANEDASRLRVRGSTVLGDIIHSRPFFVDDNDHPTVFVGSNDGMLHAFSASTATVADGGDGGMERWAYVPSMLLPKMAHLADASYGHDYYVDGQIVVATVGTGVSAKRMLFGSLGAGGKGLYALDITSLTATTDQEAANKAVWEITPDFRKYNGHKITTTDYARLGYTYGTPVVAKMDVNGTITDVVLVGNGYDQGANGEAYVYVINAATGALIRAIQVGNTGSGVPNGIFNLAAVAYANNNNYADRAYAGTLNGTMYKIDFSGNVPAGWVATPVFVQSQAITSTPAVARHPNGGLMVVFGTGKVLTGTFGTFNHAGAGSWTTPSTGDLLDSQSHYVYGIWDGAPVANDTLLDQTLTARIYTLPDNSILPVRTLTANVPNWTSGAGHHYGWRVQLPNPGERVIGEGSFIEGGRFYVNSYNPTVNPTLVPGTSTDIFGENWLMEFNYLTGGSSTTPFLDMDGNLLLNNKDRILYTQEDVDSGYTTAPNIGTAFLTPSAKGIPIGKRIAGGVQSQPVLIQLATLNTTLFTQNPDVIYPPTSTASRGVAGGHFDVDIYYTSGGRPMNCSGTTLGVAGVAASGKITFNYSSNNSTAKNVTKLKITVDGDILYDGIPNSQSPNNLDDFVVNNALSGTRFVLKKNAGSNNVLGISAAKPGTAFNGANIVVELTTNGTAPGYTITPMAGGVDIASGQSDSDTTCTVVTHEHEYDDKYDKTGVDFLHPSDLSFRLGLVIQNDSTPFKVLMMNQYLSPALMLNIEYPAYNPASLAGYVNVRDYQTSTTLPSRVLPPPATVPMAISNLPTYTLGGGNVPGYPATTKLGSLAINMPVDAFTVRDWWAGAGGLAADQRVGLHPTSPACVYNGLAQYANSAPTPSVGADMYTPVEPPADGAPGPGTAQTTTGARHNGALTLQIIRADTPDSALEMNVANRPEYGWRIKHDQFFGYVLAEYNIYWHHPRRVCYQDSTTKWYNGSSGGNGQPSASSGAWNTPAAMRPKDVFNNDILGWTKNPPDDSHNSATTSQPALGSSDPKIGAFGVAGTVLNTTTHNGVTTIKYTDGSTTVITRTLLDGGRVQIRTQVYDANQNLLSDTTVTVANADGTVTTGGTEVGRNPKTGRVSWRELFRP